MSGELEMTVRRDGGLFIPSYHVTVVSTGPVSVAESFDVQTHGGITAAVEYAMEQLRAKGYRLTAAVRVHESEQYESFATASVVRDQEQAATVELVANLVADARAAARAMKVVSTPEGAREVRRVLADLVAGAQALQARADAVLHSDARVESAAIFDDAMSHVDGGVP